MRKLLIGTLVFLIFLTSCNQSDESNTTTITTEDTTEVMTPAIIVDKGNLESVIYAFVKAYESKSNTNVNALIHPELGFTIIYREGVSDTFRKMDSINFAKPIPNYYDYPTIKSNSLVHFETLPEIDCGNEKWDKVGLFCDTTGHPNQVSHIMSFQNEFDANKYPASRIKSVVEEEKNSYRVVLSEEVPLVFHMRKYKGAWYVTTLDRAFGGCDA